jgi:hypothetical protein
LKHTVYQKEEEEETNLSLKPKEEAIGLLKLAQGNVRSSKRVDDTDSHKRSR